MALDYPLNQNDKAIIEQTMFGTIRALLFKGGLPIYTSARTDTPKQGEVWLSDISGTRKLNARISGTTYSVTLT